MHKEFNTMDFDKLTSTVSIDMIHNHTMIKKEKFLHSNFNKARILIFVFLLITIILSSNYVNHNEEIIEPSLYNNIHVPLVNNDILFSSLVSNPYKKINSEDIYLINNLFSS